MAEQPAAAPADAQPQENVAPPEPAVPEWAKSEAALDAAKDYLRQGNTLDFFEFISSGILRDHPKDLQAYCLDLVAKMVSGDTKLASAAGADGEGSNTPATAPPPKEEDDNKYMRAHNVSEFLDRWVLALLNARPASDADRLAFHSSYIESLVADKKQ